MQDPAVERLRVVERALFAAQERVAALKEALAPLAGFLPIPLGCADSTKLMVTVEAGDLRRARDLLKKEETANG